MMGEFMVCVDRIISSACLNNGNSPAARSNGDYNSPARSNGDYNPPAAAEGEGECSKNWMEDEKLNKKKGGGSWAMVECRICQEEGSESDMESPCACCGTLKFAHRKCIQKWCNKKGDITCEICNQMYVPNYSPPPPRTNSDVLAIDIRQTWGTRIDLHDSHFLAIAAAEQQLLHAEYEDYAAAHNSGIACCRVVALILMLILFFRQVLVITTDPSMVQDVSAFFNVSLQFAGFLLPCYVIARSCYLLQRQHRRQPWF